MLFKRKVYKKIKDRKDKYAPNYACLLEGARRVGKTTLAINFAKNEYKSYILIDFSIVKKEILNLFADISDLNYFFMQLQLFTDVKLYERESVIIFDEIQLFPKARQAIKHLLKDGRYDYIETGSLISIKKNVKDILIPSEELKIEVYPLDYEEFLLAMGKDPSLIEEAYQNNIPLGNIVNRKLMRDFRLYMAIGGMPQAVDTYLKTNNLIDVDKVKNGIIKLYKDDLMKIDSSNSLAVLYENIPSQLALNKKRFVISRALNKQTTNRDLERVYELINSKIVLPCYNVTDPSASLSLTKDISTFKLYLADTGLFTTLLFNNKENPDKDIYNKLLSDKLNINLGYLYENVVAQIIKASNNDLYYCSWRKKNSTHSYEIDFLLTNKGKVLPFEIKSSNIISHDSINEFINKYHSVVGQSYLICKKDVNKDGSLLIKPFYMLPFILKNLKY